MKQALRNQFSKDAVSKKDDEYFFSLAREFQTAYSRVPMTKDLGLQVRRIVYRRFKTWENFIQLALGRPARLRHWSDDQLLAWLGNVYKRLGRFPSYTEIDRESSSIASLLYSRFGDLHTAFERAIGTSVRAEILIALKKLTPPGCSTASTQEIYSELLVNHFMISKQVVANTLDYLKRNGAVIGGRRSTTNWWSLTLVGGELLKAIEKERGNGKSRA